MAQDGFIEFLLELMSATPEGSRTTARKMFGGHGIYREGLMIGLVASDVLYLKVDSESRSDFETQGLEPFRYERSGQSFAMSYHEAPPEALEEPARMAFWADKAYQAALREARKKAARGADKLAERSSSRKRSAGERTAKASARKKKAVAKKKKSAPVAGRAKKRATKRSRS